MGTVPGHGVPGFLEGFARAGDGGGWTGPGLAVAQVGLSCGAGASARSVPVCSRCHLCALPHLHLPCHLLHPHHAQGQGATALYPQNLGKHREWGQKWGQGWGSQGWAGDPITLAVPDHPPCPCRLPVSPSLGCSS